MALLLKLMKILNQPTPFLQMSNHSQPASINFNAGVSMPSSPFLSLTYAMLGGIFMGTYPVPIKTPAVLKADVHPVIFQLYKSTVVFICGFLFLIPRLIDPRLGPGCTMATSQPGTKDVPVFVFTYWGIVSAAGWIPAGLGTIFAVPIIGVSFEICIAAGSSSILQFLAFWLILGEKIKVYSCGKNCTFYMAPVWLCLIILSMCGMVYSPHFKKLPKWLNGGSYIDDGTDDKDEDELPPLLMSANNRLNTKYNSFGNNNSIKLARGNAWANAKPLSPAWILGVVAAIFCGVFASIQYSAVTLGKEYEERKEGCFRSKTICSPRLAEEFNDLGSWYVSFGIGAMLVTLFCICLLACFRFVCRLYYRNDKKNIYHGLPLIPPLHFQVMKKPGAIAGLFWVLGNVFCTLAVVTGGNAIANAQMVAAMLITSGLWGILYYAEIRKGNAIVWGFFACLTLVFMVMLGLEKVG